MAQKIKVTQIRSGIGARTKQKACLSGLGLRKINSFAILENTPAVRGMIRKVNHLVRIETTA
ncbi:MAG: 50S ribosomal protein L30 [SAR324 cluster bacterium]|nr:50S ribosomal protein L30 [SAR324 cluster bacterium]MBL7034212.1 50S ribosomal protein L30 [SAR324 cluster bacterium]